MVSDCIECLVEVESNDDLTYDIAVETDLGLAISDWLNTNRIDAWLTEYEPY